MAICELVSGSRAGSSTEISVVPTFGKVNICFAAGAGAEGAVVVLLLPHAAKIQSSVHNRIIMLTGRYGCVRRTQRDIKALTF